MTLEQAQIAYGQMRSMHEFVGHPQLAARQRWNTVSSPVGSLWALPPPGLPDGTVPAFEAIPAVGQHTEGILREIGFDDEQIAVWYKQGTADYDLLRTPTPRARLVLTHPGVRRSSKS
jgi:itaconate CoA-transferase